MRFEIQLPNKVDWVKVFEPRDATLFVATNAPPEIGQLVRIDMTVGSGGPKVILRGKVIARRLQGDTNLPKGCNIALGTDEREKINYLNGFVRGGLLNLRERRRIPVRLKVTYGGMTGPVDSVTRDINEEGVFVVSEEPLPEESELHLFIHFPGLPRPFELVGIVSHTVVVEDDDVPGMGIRFRFRDSQSEEFAAAVDRLEQDFQTGSLPDECLV